MEAMSIVVSRERTSPLRISRRAAVCLLLGIFFLYNPFFTICPASGPSAAIQHHVSYRSTIASSELGCSNLQHSTISVALMAALISTCFDLVQPSCDVRSRPVDESILITHEGFAAPLRSRPPPPVTA
jgi:hypothetical protein